MGRFSGTVRRQGEWFLREDGTTRFKASITNTTKAATNPSNRAFLFDGLIFKGATVGEYITREINNSKYLVETLHPQPRDNELQSAFLAQCNQIVALAREKLIDAGSNISREWEIYAERVLGFKDIDTRALRATNDGLAEQDIITVHIPAVFGVKRLDRVYFIRQGVELKDSECFQVDSINDSLTPLDELIDHSGIDVLQLTRDTRTGDVATDPTEEPPDDGGGTDLGGGGSGYWD